MSTTGGALLALAMTNINVSKSYLPKCTTIEVSEHSSHASTVKSTAHLVLGIYQNGISPADGSNCTLSPSCSSYAVAANERFGPVRATIMSGARIVKDHVDPSLNRCIDSKGRIRFEHLPPTTEKGWWAID